RAPPRAVRMPPANANRLPGVEAGLHRRGRAADDDGVAYLDAGPAAPADRAAEAVVRLSLDYETRSEVDLKKCGLHVYAEHPSTEILCAAYALGDGPVLTWRRGMNPTDLIRALALADEVHAHNAQFERSITNGAAGRKLGLPSLFVKQMRCTMVMGYALGLPGSLKDMAPALGVGARKDLAGHRTM